MSFFGRRWPGGPRPIDERGAGDGRACLTPLPRFSRRRSAHAEHARPAAGPGSGQRAPAAAKRGAAARRAIAAGFFFGLAAPPRALFHTTHSLASSSMSSFFWHPVAG